MQENKEKAVLTPIMTITFGLSLSVIVGIIVCFFVTLVMYFILKSSDLSYIEPVYKKAMSILPGILLGFLSAIGFFSEGMGKEHPIPEIEEQKAFQKELEKILTSTGVDSTKKKEESAKTEKTTERIPEPAAVEIANCTPLTIKSSYIPPDFLGFYFFLGKIVDSFYLSPGVHWKFPGLMKIGASQTAIVSCRFVAGDYCKLNGKITKSKDKEGEFNLGKLAGSIPFVADGVISFRVYDVIKWFLLDDSTRRIKVISYMREASRDFIRKSSPETLFSEKSREALQKTLHDTIAETDGDGTTIDNLGVKVETINLERLRPSDPEVLEKFELVAKTQLNEFADLQVYENLKSGVKALKDVGITDAQKAAEIILANDGKATYAAESRDFKIRTEGNSDGVLLTALDTIASTFGKKQNNPSSNRPRIGKKGGSPPGNKK